MGILPKIKQAILLNIDLPPMAHCGHLQLECPRRVVQFTCECLVDLWSVGVMHFDARGGPPLRGGSC